MKYLAFILILLAIFQSSTLSQQILNQAPIIGVLLQPSSFVQDYPPDIYSYLPAAYIKFVEMGGARAVPIYYDAPQEYYDELIPQLNGILFPGGDSDFDIGTTFGDTGYYIYKMVKEINDSGIYYPLWGTCQGFEMFAYFENDFSRSILSRIEDEDKVNDGIDIQYFGRLYQNMTGEQVDIAKERVQFYYHSWAISEVDFKNNKKITDFFHLSSTSTNSVGEVFVASMEAKNYPFFSTQFHPEDNNFDWKLPANHKLPGVLNTQHYSTFFMQQARFNANTFKSQELFDAINIYNYNPVYTVNDDDYNQVYFFKNYSLLDTEEKIQYY